MMKFLIAAAMVVTIAVPCTAKWIELAATRTTVAHSNLSIVAGDGWNRNSRNATKKQETWSFDGPLLNRIDFFGGIANGEAISAETNKKREPLPKFNVAMHASDVAELIERTVRITEHTPDFVVDAVSTCPFAGKTGFCLRFHYTTGELLRRGELRGGIADSKLYMIEYSAPALFYFDAHLAKVVAIMDSAQLT